MTSDSPDLWAIPSWLDPYGCGVLAAGAVGGGVLGGVGCAILGGVSGGLVEAILFGIVGVPLGAIAGTLTLQFVVMVAVFFAYPVLQAYKRRNYWPVLSGAGGAVFALVVGWQEIRGEGPVMIAIAVGMGLCLGVFQALLIHLLLCGTKAVLPGRRDRKPSQISPDCVSPPTSESYDSGADQRR